MAETAHFQKQRSGVMLYDELYEMLKKVFLNSNEITPPSVEVEEGETVIEELPNELKRAWIVWKTFEKKWEQFVQKNSMVFAEPDLIKHLPQHKQDAFYKEGELNSAAKDLAKEIFWTSLRYYFKGKVCRKRIGIRKDWKVVVSELPKKAISAGFIIQIPKDLFE